ncbi:MAG: hypothetical protein CTY18_08495 [Methylomonas sp.]|uniref:hypothetical protein n=1 Tax=Flavobacterium sp. TaxID=239 RepID=UPI000D2A444A|nr:hypothetical protein [Flavobacterium sp.]MBA4155807.1 hypothetical protein [Flavobacterium sp.]PPD17698.1 MAG: hypothetical protein CTY24_14440 [Methylobacter sp.]PPD34423.1 MAG: hypothetical protein CTY18_08495 [Methylomonas sp.]
MSSLSKVLKALPDVFSLQPNDYSDFLPTDSVAKNFQNRWSALGSRLQKASDLVDIPGYSNNPSERQVEIVTSITRDSIREELIKTIKENKIDSTTIDVDAIFDEYYSENTIREIVRTILLKDSNAAKFHNRNNYKKLKEYKKLANAKKETLKRA